MAELRVGGMAIVVGGGNALGEEVTTEKYLGTLLPSEFFEWDGLKKSLNGGRDLWAVIFVSDGVKAVWEGRYLLPVGGDPDAETRESEQPLETPQEVTS